MITLPDRKKSFKTLNPLTEEKEKLQKTCTVWTKLLTEQTAELFSLTSDTILYKAPASCQDLKPWLYEEMLFNNTLIST